MKLALVPGRGNFLVGNARRCKFRVRTDADLHVTAGQSGLAARSKARIPQRGPHGNRDHADRSGEVFKGSTL